MEKTLPRMFRETAKKYPELTAQMSRISEGVWDSISYKNAFEMGVCTGSASAFSEDLATKEEVKGLYIKTFGKK